MEPPLSSVRAPSSVVLGKKPLKDIPQIPKATPAPVPDNHVEDEGANSGELN